MKNRFLALIPLCLLFLSTEILLAQWVEYTLPHGPKITAISGTGDGEVFAVVNGDTLYSISSAGGSGRDGTFSDISDFAVGSGSVYMATVTGVFRLTHSGSYWTSTNISTLPNTTCVAVSGSSIFIANYYAVRRSTDNGSTWTVMDAGMPHGGVNALLVNGTRLFAGTDTSGVYVSTNSGTSWSPVNTGLPTRKITRLSANDTYLFAGTEEGMFVSSNNGASWTACTFGVPLRNGHQPAIHAFAVIGTRTFVALDSVGVFVSSDNGATWSDVSSNLPENNVMSIGAVGTRLYAGTSMCGLYQSDNNGASWTSVLVSLNDRDLPTVTGIGIQSIPGGPSTVFVGTDRAIYRTTNNGGEWKVSANGMNKIAYMITFDGHSETVHLKWPSATTFAFSPASDGSGGTNVFVGTDMGGIFLSKDGGMNWSKVNSGLPISLSGTAGHADQKYFPVAALTINGSTLWAGFGNGRVYRSTDNGSSWRVTNSGMPKTDVSSIVCFPSPVDPHRTDLLAGSLRSNSMQEDTYIDGGGVFRSVDDGSNWTTANEGLEDLEVADLAVQGTNIFAATKGGVYLSTDAGNTWTGTSPFVQDHPSLNGAAELALSGTNIFAMSIRNGLWLSTDNGSSWTKESELTKFGGEYTTHAAVGSQYVWLSYGLKSIYRRPLAEMVPQLGVLSTSFDQINSSAFPQVKSVISVKESSGLPLGDLGAGNFVVTEDGVAETPLTVTPVGSTGGPVSIMMAIDRGESMGSAGLTGAKTFANEFLRLFQRDDSAGVISFDSQVTFNAAFTPDINTLRNVIVDIREGKSSAIYDALYEAITRVQRHTGNKAVLLISGGLDKSSIHNEADVFELAHHNGVPVYVVGFPSSSQTEELLAKIGKVTGGAYYRDPGGSGTSGIYQSIAQAVRNQYQITYTSHRPTADASTRTVSITTLFDNKTDTRQMQYVAPSSTTAASVVPSCAAQVPAGIPFWVDVKVGEPNRVTDLYGVSFKLKSSISSCTYVSGSGTAGTFLGTTPLTLFQTIDAQTVNASITKTTAPGVSGTGIVARFQFTTPSSLSATTNITFTLSASQANNSSGAAVQLSLGSLTVSVSPATSVWPGDCDNSGSVTAADVLPIGLYYGLKNAASPVANNPGIQWQAYKRSYWLTDSLGKKTYADADGNGLVEGADVLAVGLNYGKAMSVVGKAVSVDAPIAQTAQQADGTLEITSAIRSSENARKIRLPIVLKAPKPVYGIAYTLKSSNGEKFIQIDTSGHPLGEALLVTRVADGNGSIDVGITSTRGNGFSGTGQLMTVEVEVSSDDVRSVDFDLSVLAALDASGNAMSVSGSSFKGPVADHDQSSFIPTECNLSQNYPNPFNPVTTIRADISARGHVDVRVFDMLGRVVAVLMNEERGPGSYLLRWDASTMPSGVYYCRMTATEKTGSAVTRTRRMALVK